MIRFIRSSNAYPSPYWPGQSHCIKTVAWFITGYRRGLKRRCSRFFFFFFVADNSQKLVGGAPREAPTPGMDIVAKILRYSEPRWTFPYLRAPCRRCGLFQNHQFCSHPRRTTSACRDHPNRTPRTKSAPRARRDKGLSLLSFSLLSYLPVSQPFFINDHSILLHSHLPWHNRLCLPVRRTDVPRPRALSRGSWPASKDFNRSALTVITPAHTYP